MSFLGRLGYFFGGLAIGLVVLSFFLSKKNVDFCYFPNCRVLKDISKKPLNYSKEINQLMLNKTLDSLSIINVLRNGDIDFSESNTESTPCKTYVVEGLDLNEKEITLEVLNCNDKVIVNKLK